MVGGQRYPALLPGSIFKLDREWSGVTRLLLTLPMKAELSRGHHKSAVVLRGTAGLRVKNRGRLAAGKCRKARA